MSLRVKILHRQDAVSFLMISSIFLNQIETGVGLDWLAESQERLRIIIWI